jgi:hypothetical protein
MPGLLRGVARTAVVAGTATAVSGRVARRQATRYADQDQAIAANRGAGYAQGYQSAGYESYQQAPPAAPEVDVVEQLKELASLKDQGILTEEEFAAQKAKLLNT